MKVTFTLDWITSAAIEVEFGEFHIPQIGSYVEDMKISTCYGKDCMYISGYVTEVRMTYCESTFKLENVDIILGSLK